MAYDITKEIGNFFKSWQFGADVFDATHNEENPTQTIQYKALAPVANVVSNLPKRLEETAQWDQDIFQKQIRQKQEWFVADMLAQGHKEEDIFSALDVLKAKGEFDYKPGFASRLVSWLGTRLGEVNRTTEALSNEQNAAKRMTAGALSYGGDLVAGALEPVAAAISPVVQKVIEKTGQTENVQELSQQWDSFKQQNPLLADSIEWIVNVGQLAPLPKVWSLVKSWASKVPWLVKAGAVATEAISPVLSKVWEKVAAWGSKLKSAIIPDGAGISTRANRFNALDEQKFIQATWETPGQFATSRGLTQVGDKAVEEAVKNFEASKTVADDAFWAIEGKFKYTGPEEDLVRTTITDLADRLNNVKSPEAPRINAIKSKYDTEGLTMGEVNDIKRTYARNFKYTFADAGSESALKSTNLQNAIREWQFDVARENGLTNIAEINKNTQGWKMFADSLAKKLDRSGANNAIGITDWIALSGGNPANLALFLGKKSLSSSLVKSSAIKLLSKKTKPNIIKASTEWIVKSNLQKNVNPTGIPSGVSVPGGKSMVRPAWLLKKPSSETIAAHNETQARLRAKKASTEQAKKIIAKENKNNEALKSPDITERSKIVSPYGKWLQKKDAPEVDTRKIEAKRSKLRSNEVRHEDKWHVNELYDHYIKDNKLGKNIIIDSDKVKELFHDYDPKNPGTVHETSSVLSKKFFEKALRETKTKKVVFTAWGGGSGKSEILIRSIPENDGAVIFDGTGKNYKKLVGMYDMAKQMGKEPEIAAAYINYSMAKHFNSKRGRNVPEDILADTHKGYRKSLLKLVKERPDIKVNLYINTGERYSNGKPVSVKVPHKLLQAFLELRQELE